MTLAERMDRLEKSAGKNDDMVRELRDAVTVTAHLEAQHSRAMKDHANWLVRHDEAMESLGKRIADLVSGIGAFIACK